MPAKPTAPRTPSPASKTTSASKTSPPKTKTPSPPPKTPSPPPTVTVFVSIYKPTDSRDPCHWAIFLNGKGASDVILQVSDDKHGVGYYVEKPMWGKFPQKSGMHKESIPVGTITAASLKTAVTVINSTPVDNKSTTWNCQAWCVEALDALQGNFGFKWSSSARSDVIKKRQNWQ